KWSRRCCSDHQPWRYRGAAVSRHGRTGACPEGRAGNRQDSSRRLRGRSLEWRIQGGVMLYQIGTITLDTRPFNVDDVERSASADFAVKAVMGSLPVREFMGEGDEKLTITGALKPTKIGGLTELEALHEMRRSGQRVPVMRGD